MSKTLFLSHSYDDRKAASVLRDALRLVSAGQLDLWFSSDVLPRGGLHPGDWYQQIKTRLGESKTLIALLTPESLSSRWIHFECGLGDASGVLVIPICLGISSLGDLPLPLSRYQSYQLSDYDSLKMFMGKLFDLHGLELFEQVAAPVLKRAIAEFAVATKVADNDEKGALGIKEAVEAIKRHIDKRIFGSHVAVGGTQDGCFVPYGISIDCDALMRRASGKLVINIEANTTLQDVLDDIYYGIAQYVGAFEYLTKWILHERTSKKLLVVREVSDLIPAHYVFRPADDWAITALTQPYHPRNSKDSKRWYRTAEQGS